MRCLVDFALQDLFSALDRESSDFAAQRFARLDDLLLRVRLRLREDASGFSLCLGLDFVSQRHCALFGVSNTLLAVVACLRQFLVDALVRGFQFCLALLSSRQTFGDLLRALVEGVDQRRPHELHREPREDQEHDHLRKQGCVEIHGVSLNVASSESETARRSSILYSISAQVPVPPCALTSYSSGAN